jgi:PAS domain S-box-containing protein
MMETEQNEEELLKSVALQTANSILIARRRAEELLLQTKEALEKKSSELAHSLSMMNATLESTTDAILVTDENGRVITWNRKFAEMWRIPPEIIKTAKHLDLVEVTEKEFVAPRKFRERIQAIYATAPSDTFDVLETADGRILERYSKLQRIDTRNVGRVWSFRDISERKRAEAEREELLVSEQQARERAETEMRIKDEFLATLSHELRTPLNAILGWASILRTTENPEELAEGLEVIERNAHSQTKIIEDLLDMSRIISGNIRLDVQRVDLVTVVNAAIESMKPTAVAKTVRLTSVLDPLASPVSGDPGRLQQILWNLLTNALKFTPKGGRVHVVLERVNSHLEISVTDSGRGISPAFLPHVFDRFRQADASTTREERGLGLGLSIVKNLVELHGGSVRAKSPGLNQGSSFIVALPMVSANICVDPDRTHPRAVSGEIVTEKLDLRDVQVLAVDDEVDARRLIKRILSGCGAIVETAESGATAIRFLRKAKPDVLIMDIGMPGEDGYTVIQKVRQLAKADGGGVPAIALTAFARSEDRRRAALSGFQMHLAKPVEPSELIAMVASLAGRNVAAHPDSIVPDASARYRKNS